MVSGAGKDLLLGKILPSVYQRGAGKPVNPRKVLFVEHRDGQLSDNFRLIYKALDTIGGFTLHVHTLPSQRLSYVETVRKGIALIKDMADAGCVFLCDGNDIVSCVDKRPETKVVQLWHGCGAFKKWGMSTVGNRFGPDGNGMRRHPYYRNLDLVTVSSPEVIWAYEEAMDLKGTKTQILPTGVSRTDMFFDPGRWIAARERLEKVYPQTEGRTLLLYAPTFRGKPSDAKAPDGLDLRKLAQSLPRSYMLLIRQHPFVREKMVIPEDLEGSFALDVSEDSQEGGLGIEELLIACDQCITDYSSLIFEFALLEKPLLFFAFDIADYQDWRGFYYSYEEMTPGPVCTDTERLAEEILRAQEHFDVQRIREFRQKYMSACDGQATRRILAWVFGDTFDCQNSEAVHG